MRLVRSGSSGPQVLAACYEQAEARAPELKGMFAIGIETLAHDELGAIVDVADPAASNEVSDRDFFECIRESAFTVVFPPPLTTGQKKFEITGYFGEMPPPTDPDPSKPTAQPTEARQ